MLQSIPFDYSSKSAGLLIKAVNREQFLVDARNKIHQEFREESHYHVNMFVFSSWQEIVKNNSKSHLIKMFTDDEFLFSEYLKGVPNKEYTQSARESTKLVMEKYIAVKANILFLAH